MAQTITQVGHKMRAVREEGGAELTKSPAKILALGAVATSLAFAWSGGNEAFIAMFGGRMIQTTHDAVLTAATTGLISFSEQSVLGIIASIGIANIPRTMAAIHKHFYGKSEDPSASAAAVDVRPNPKLPLRDHLGALALGSTLSTLLRNRNHAYSLGENVRNAVIDAGFIGTANFTLGAAAAGLTNLGIAAGQEAVANAAINVISSPLTWLGVFAVYKLGPMAVRTTSDFVHARFGIQPNLAAEPLNEGSTMAGPEDL